MRNVALCWRGIAHARWGDLVEREEKPGSKRDGKWSRPPKKCAWSSFGTLPREKTRQDVVLSVFVSGEGN